MSKPHSQFTFNRVLAAVATLLCSSSSNEAHALQFRVTELYGCDAEMVATTSCFGSVITIGLRVEGDPGEEIYGLEASVYGYNESDADFTSGQAVSSIFHAVTLPSVGSFSGLSNTLVPAPAPGTVGAGSLFESSIGSHGNRVSIFRGVGLAAVRYNPLDPGLNGVIGGEDTQFRISFTIHGIGITYLQIGTGYEGDGVIYAGGQVGQSNPLTIVVGPDIVPYVVPEPGMVVLIGLGLAGLASRSERATRRP